MKITCEDESAGLEHFVIYNTSRLARPNRAHSAVQHELLIHSSTWSWEELCCVFPCLMMSLAMALTVMRVLEE